MKMLESRARRLAGLLLLVALVAACGGDGGTTTTTAGESTESTATAVETTEAASGSTVADGDAELVPVSIVSGVDQSFTHFYVADTLGLWEKHGIDATTETFSSGTAAARTVLAGERDVAISATLAVVSAQAQGSPAVIVGSVRPGADGFAAVVARDDITQPEDLLGRSIAFSEGSTSSHLWMNLYAEYHGLDLEQATLVNLQPQEMMIALERGDVDAAFTFVPWITEAIEANDDLHILAWEQDPDPIFNANIGITVSAAMAERPDDVAKVLQALIEADEFIESNYDEAVEIVSEYLDVPLEEMRGYMDAMNYRVDMSEDTFVDLCQNVGFLIEQGEITSAPNWDEAVRPEFMELAAPDRVTYDEFIDCHTDG